MKVQKYKSLFSFHKDQPHVEVFAYFGSSKDPLTGKRDYQAPFRKIADRTLEGPESWEFATNKFKSKHHGSVPKLRNYLRYTFLRLVDLELLHPDEFFIQSANGDDCCFNTGLQDKNSADLYAIFSLYKPKGPTSGQITNLGSPHPRYDWVFVGVASRQEAAYRERFSTRVPALAWYSNDSRDYIFNTQFALDSDIFDHMFARARERSGFSEDASDESVRNYLRGAIQGLLPKIKRNYKTAIPMYYIAEKRMQLLLPFHSAIGKDISCLLVERDDIHSCYKVKTILDMDQAFFAARLITRPDKEWLNP